MKKTILLFLLLTVSVFVNGQDPKYMKAMEKNVTMIDSSQDPLTITTAGNAFERIAVANPKEWLPLYYQAFCSVVSSMRQDSPSKIDEMLDKAEALINKADELSPNNSEIVVVQSWITSMKIGVDPMTRGQKLGPAAAALSEKAIQLNPENPRAHFLKGSSLFYRPEQWGGGKDKALPVLETAMEKFKAAKNENAIVPHWGEKNTAELIEKCKVK